MSNHVQCYQRISFTKEFSLTMERFRQLIPHDIQIATTIKEADQSKGIFSAAVRQLIQQYVDRHWPEFVRAQQLKLKGGEKDGATQDRNPPKIPAQ